MRRGKLHECSQGHGTEFGGPSQRHRPFPEELQRNEFGGFLGYIALIELGGSYKLGRQIEIDGSHT